MNLFNATCFKDLGSSDVQDIVPRKFSSDGVIVWAEFHGQFRLFSYLISKEAC